MVRAVYSYNAKFKSITYYTVINSPLAHIHMHISAIVYISFTCNTSFASIYIFDRSKPCWQAGRIYTSTYICEGIENFTCYNVEL